MMIDDEINAILKKKNYKSGDIELYSGRSVYVYGAGSVGREIGNILKERDVRVEAKQVVRNFKIVTTAFAFTLPSTTASSDTFSGNQGGIDMEIAKKIKESERTE